MRLEIGAGKCPTPGYTHLDIVAYDHIEIVADGRAIPLSDESCIEVYSHWVLEHFTHEELPDVLKEWMRVLKPDGELRIVTSNQKAINKAWEEREIAWEEWIRLTFGERPDTYENCHKVGFTPLFLRKLLKGVGLKKIKIDAAWKCHEENGALKCPGLIAFGFKWKL